MESIYYVLCWHCHRRCKHCYDERFRPYVRGELEAVVGEAERNAPAIVDNLPARLTYLDLVKDPAPGGPRFVEHGCHDGTQLIVTGLGKTDGRLNNLGR